MPCVYVKEMGIDIESKKERCRKFAEGVYEEGIGPGGGVFTLANTISKPDYPYTTKIGY